MKLNQYFSFEEFINNVGDLKFGVYHILNNVTNQGYVGITTGLFKIRIRNHFRGLKKNRHFNDHLQNSFNKHGIESFKICILDFASNLVELNNAELFHSFCHGENYNLKQCGSAGCHSEETKKRISEIKKDFYNNNPEKRKDCSERMKLKCSDPKERELMSHRIKYYRKENPDKAKEHIERLNDWRKNNPPPTQKPYSFINPKGECVTGINLTKYCEENRLVYKTFINWLNGNKLSYKGYTRTTEDYLTLMSLQVANLPSCK